MYVNMLQQRELMLRFNNQGVPAWEDRFLRVGFPLAARWAKGALAIEPGIEVADEAIVWQEFDYVAELLSDGRPYLVTDTLRRRRPHLRRALRLGHRAADLRRPPPPARRCCRRTSPRWSTRAREHPAGAFALGLYEKHRRERVGDAVAA